jgi:hypothetical protein
VDAKRHVRTDDLREPALHRKPTSHCIAANVRLWANSGLWLKSMTATRRGVGLEWYFAS